MSTRAVINKSIKDFKKDKDIARKMLANGEVNKNDIIKEIKKHRTEVAKKNPTKNLKPINDISEEDIVRAVAMKLQKV